MSATSPPSSAWSRSSWSSSWPQSFKLNGCCPCRRCGRRLRVRHPFSRSLSSSLSAIVAKSRHRHFGSRDHATTSAGVDMVKVRISLLEAMKTGGKRQVWWEPEILVGELDMPDDWCVQSTTGAINQLVGAIHQKVKLTICHIEWNGSRDIRQWIDNFKHPCNTDRFLEVKYLPAGAHLWPDDVLADHGALTETWQMCLL